MSLVVQEVKGFGASGLQRVVGLRFGVESLGLSGLHRII